MIFSSVKLSYTPEDYVPTVPLPSLVLPIRGLEMSSPIRVKSIVGLDPPEKDVFISNTADSGGYRQGSSVAPRQITMLIGYQPDYRLGQTYSQLRRTLQAWMTPKLGLPIRFSLLNAAGAEVLYTYGEFSKFEASIFTKDPESQMVFDCLDGYLYAPEYNFPDIQNMSTDPIVINNPGDAPSPFSLIATVTAPTNWLILSDSYNTSMNFQMPFIVGDVIAINTTPGKRSTTYIRSGLTYNLAPYQGLNSKWLMLHEGVNHLTPENDTQISLNEFKIYSRYWGV